MISREFLMDRCIRSLKIPWSAVFVSRSQSTPWSAIIAESSFARAASPNGRRIAHSNAQVSCEWGQALISSRSLSRSSRSPVTTVRSLSSSQTFRSTKSGARRTSAPTSSARWFLSTEVAKSSSIRKRLFRCVTTFATRCSDFSRPWKMATRMRSYFSLSNISQMKRKMKGRKRNSRSLWRDRKWDWLTWMTPGKLLGWSFRTLTGMLKRYNNRWSVRKSWRLVLR